jgi:serine phosphatase RsbU (regulator of sigma subunit)/anti-sigma regulatory factor (Ser/Thr protein kinase)
MGQALSTNPRSRALAVRAPVWTPYAGRLVVVGAAYYVTAYFSLKLSLVGASVTPFWPPTGIAVVAFLVWGPALWPAVTLAAFAVNATVSGPVWAAAVIAAGNTLAPLAALRLLRLAGFREAITTLRDALAVLFASLTGTLLSATIGSLALLASHGIAAGALLPTWSVWWAGDAMGMLIVAPFLLVARSVRSIRFAWPRTAEVAAEFTLLLGGSLLIFATARPVWVLVFPLLALIAWRLHLPGAAPAALLVSTIAILAAVADDGPFRGSDLLGRMLGLHSFNAAVAFTSLFLATVVAERSRVREALERAAIGLEHVVERRTAIVETFQRSMLPQSLPDIADVELAARYVPAGTEGVGGDWYDAVALPNGRLVVCIGDVAGHGTQAAATMAQLRMAARAYALDDHSPAVALEQLNLLAATLGSDTMATLLYLVVDPETGSYVFASAGHLPPLVTTRSGASSFLEGGLAAPIGSARYVTYREAAGTLEPGATLMLYTDGLVENRGDHVDAGLDALARAASSAPVDLESACDHVLSSGGAPRSDDVALVAIRRRVLGGHRLDLRRPAEPRSLTEIRRVMRRWLAENGVASDVVGDVLLACSEACTNVIQHAYGRESGLITVAASIADHELHLTVRDDGRWRSRRRAPVAAGGHGVETMRAVMDAVDVVGAPSGTEVRMKRTIGSQ